MKVVGILILSHGNLAEAFISSAQSILGALLKVGGVSIRPKESMEEVKLRVLTKMKEVDDGDGVMILTDIPGGTPTNLAEALLESGNVEVVTGINMPMLLTLSSCRQGRSLREIGRMVKKSGRRSIVLARELLGQRGEPGTGAWPSK
jgi:PTS system mannose-specific IIA component